VRAGNRCLRFAPSAGREQEFSGGPFDGIDGDDVDIAVQTSVLESIIENENISELLAFGEKTTLVSIYCNDDWNVFQTPLD